MFINLTPHVIKVQVQDTARGTFHIRAYAPEPVSARVAAVEEVIGLIDTTGLTFTVSRHTFGKIENLPEPQPGVVFIVSGMVRDALDGRPDVFAPDTGKSAVRQQGQVEFVTCLRGK